MGLLLTSRISRTISCQARLMVEFIKIIFEYATVVMKRWLQTNQLPTGACRTVNADNVTAEEDGDDDQNSCWMCGFRHDVDEELITFGFHLRPENINTRRECRVLAPMFRMRLSWGRSKLWSLLCHGKTQVLIERQRR